MNQEVREAIKKHIKDFHKRNPDRAYMSKRTMIARETDVARSQGQKHKCTNALSSVIEEMHRQDLIHGADRHQDPRDWFPIFVEEVGEVATAMQEKSNLREELVQVAAVALQWIEDIDRDGVNL